MNKQMNHNGDIRIILVAGVPRSGSTWLYNAARLLITESGINFHSAWIADWRSENTAATHLVKVHHRGEIERMADLVLTSRRPTQECLASLVRMGWLEDDADEIRKRWKTHQDLYEYWHERSSLEVDYEDIVHRPEFALQMIAEVLGVVVSSEFCRLTASKLREMREPSEGSYDSETLLHPGHRKNYGTETLSPEKILNIVQE